jgi:hypothetical protein
VDKNRQRQLKSARFQRVVFGILPNTALRGSNPFGKDAERGTLEACATEFRAINAQLRPLAGFPRNEKSSSDARCSLKETRLTQSIPWRPWCQSGH